MDPLKMSCEGVTIGSVEIPRFQLRLGEFVCLHLPGPLSSEEEKQSILVLTGRRPVSGLRLFGRTCWAQRPASRGGLFEFFQRPRAVDWLQRAGDVSRAQARAIVERLGLRPDWRISQLAANPSTLLGLEASWARGAEVVVFSTSGCDPLGKRAIYEAVTSRLDRCAAIHLSHPNTKGEWTCRDFFPRAFCIQLSRPTGPPASLTPA